MNSKILSLLAVMGIIHPTPPVYASKPSTPVAPYMPPSNIPKGAKKWFFNKDGGVENDPRAFNKSEIVFDCVARDEANARRKYNNWNIQHYSKVTFE